MIVVDIETSGLYPNKNGIVEIGSLVFENPNRTYNRLCRLDPEDEIDPVALELNGQSEKDVRDLNRISQKEMLGEFFEWIRKEGDFYVAGENVGWFDLAFIKIKADKYGSKFPFQHRSFDLNTAAQTRHKQVYGRFLTENGKSKMGLPEILEFVGFKDNRKKHKALEDCKLEAECIFRLLNGENLISEYNKFPIPDYLKRNKNDNL